MTSEVLMLNKGAVVMAADSAVTTGRNPHPRYSKAANKIFDLSIHGNVAVTIFASADIDRVPWELVLKQFRNEDISNPQRSKLSDYVPELIKYLEGNLTLFPTHIQTDILTKNFFQSAVAILERIGAKFPDFINENKLDAERIKAWNDGFTSISQELNALSYHAPLSDKDYQNILVQSATFQNQLASELPANVEYLHADAQQLTTLAIEYLVKQPTSFLNYTGIVFAGYGKDEIFPSMVHIKIYGHIGNTLLWNEVNTYAITHDNEALILPFAQSSMIDRFTDGFDSSLSMTIRNGSLNSFNNIIADINAAGFAIPNTVTDPIITKHHSEFMTEWRKSTWDENFHPLRRVLNSLSVPEMGHLAESLLVLEELRERVTSPSESVGGPIDVVAITKAEGLIWLKRKHFFDPELNQRYISRSKLVYN